MRGQGDGSVSTVLAMQAEDLSSDPLYPHTPVMPGLGEQSGKDSCSLQSSWTNLKVSYPVSKTKTKETPDCSG